LSSTGRRRRELRGRRDARAGNSDRDNDHHEKYEGRGGYRRDSSIPWVTTGLRWSRGCWTLGWRRSLVTPRCAKERGEFVGTLSEVSHDDTPDAMRVLTEPTSSRNKVLSVAAFTEHVPLRPMKVQFKFAI
jgi:hypothetical protein